MTYLYGASVQGIQGFIFRTNELRDIAGASELVEQICTRMFAEMLGNKYKEENQIIAAAGNVKYKFDNREDCEYAVLNFPRIVMTSASGITISQAVVSYDRGDFKTAIDGLEKKLHTARNKPSLPTTVGLLGVERSRQTGLPVIAQEYIVKEGDRNLLTMLPSGRICAARKRICRVYAERAFTGIRVIPYHSASFVLISKI